MSGDNEGKRAPECQEQTPHDMQLREKKLRGTRRRGKWFHGRLRRGRGLIEDLDERTAWTAFTAPV